MSVASLTKMLAGLSKAGQGETDRYRSLEKSLKGVERSLEKLQTLKNKVKKLDPNQESMNNIRLKVSSSSHSVRSNGSTKSSSNIRKSLVAGFPELENAYAEGADDQEELQGKI